MPERARRWYAAGGVLFVCSLSLFFYFDQPASRLDSLHRPSVVESVVPRETGNGTGQLAERASESAQGNGTALSPPQLDAGPASGQHARPPRVEAVAARPAADAARVPDVRSEGTSAGSRQTPARSGLEAGLTVPPEVESAPGRISQSRAPLARNALYDVYPMAPMPTLPANERPEELVAESVHGTVPRALATAGRQTARGFRKVGAALSKVF